MSRVGQKKEKKKNWNFSGHSKKGIIETPKEVNVTSIITFLRLHDKENFYDLSANSCGEHCLLWSHSEMFEQYEEYGTLKHLLQLVAQHIRKKERNPIILLEKDINEVEGKLLFLAWIAKMDLCIG